MHAIVGAGTGLGIARGIISGEKLKVLASEGGHVEYSPKSKLEWDLKIWLKNYLKVERISFNLPLSKNCFKNKSDLKFLKCFDAVPPEIHNPPKHNS